jgi:hypothetical protein
MGKCCPVVFAVLTLLVLMIAGLGGCGGRSGSAAGPNVPAAIVLTPASASLEMGQQQQFTASALDFNKRPITIAVTYSSSNTAVLTISNGGLACAGTWDSLQNPITCTPGPAGVATVTASASGVVSSPATIYVHPHVDHISVTPLNVPPITCNPASGGIGIPQNQAVDYQAAAFSQGIDVTATVGPFTWSQASTTIAKLNTSASGLRTNQVVATANEPGLTQISVSVAGVTSSPVDFQTCPVSSITLQLAEGSGNSLNFATSGTATVRATVKDSLGNTLTTLPTLTWSSSEPLVATAAQSGNIGGTVSALKGGGSTITASCIPPTCNAGLVPSQPIYPNSSISVTVSPSATPSGTVWVASTGCGTNFACTSSIVSIAIPANTLGGAATLPNTPNSLLFDRQGKTAFLGSENGLMVVTLANVGSTTNPVSAFSKVTGKVLAVSPNGTRIVVSDTSTSPNQVFIFDQSNQSSPVDLLITGATAAAFSPDNLKAFIVAGSKLYVYSTQDPLTTVTLGAPASDVTFLPSGAFGYLAGGSGSAASVTAVTTCNNAVANSAAATGTLLAIRSLVDGTRLVALDPPGIDVVTTQVTGTGCSQSITTSAAPTVNIGQGQFTPVNDKQRQLLVSTDGTKAYVLAKNLGSVPVYDIVAGTASAIGLTGNATVEDGDLTLDGTLLYVAASDGTVHALNTGTASDNQTITLPPNFNFCNNVSFVCTPDLLGIQP